MQTETAPVTKTLPTKAVSTSATCPQCGTTQYGIWRTPPHEPELYECIACERRFGYVYFFRATPKVYERKGPNELDPELCSSDALRLRLWRTHPNRAA